MFFFVNTRTTCETGKHHHQYNVGKCLFSTPVLLHYAATKAVIQNFSANLSQILLKEEKGIRVNALAPGPVWAPLIPSTMPEPENFGEDNQ